MTHALVAHDTTNALSHLLMEGSSAATIRRKLGADFTRLHQYWRSSLTNPLSSLAERGGKEFRARLLATAWEIAGGRDGVPDELVAIVEGLHLGSLVVDDIEDGSKTRRGAPSLHELCGVPVALNAGNWIYFWAPELLSRLDLRPDVELDLRRAINETVLRAHYGQALDLTVRVTELRQHQVAEAVYATSVLKTGALMGLAARLGSAAASHNPMLVDAMTEFGQSVGVSLQMLDDLTSVMLESRADKGREDICLGRATWPWVWLAITDSLGYARLRQLQREVMSGKANADLLLQQLRSRIMEVGRFEVNQKLSVSLAECTRRLGTQANLDRLVQWVADLKEYAR